MIQTVAKLSRTAEKWSERGDSNPGPLPPQGGGLSNNRAITGCSVPFRSQPFSFGSRQSAAKLRPPLPRRAG